MARPKKTQETPATDPVEFDVPNVLEAAESENPDTVAESDEVEEIAAPTQPQPIETPEQRRIMRAKRIAKAQSEHLRRLTRQYPVVARLVQENQALKKRVEGQG